MKNFKPGQLLLLNDYSIVFLIYRCSKDTDIQLWKVLKFNSNSIELQSRFLFLKDLLHNDCKILVDV